VIFPVFPDPVPVTFDAETELVMMPLWYWEQVAQYKIDIDALETYLNKLREAGANSAAGK
jgi:hypothetical protein